MAGKCCSCNGISARCIRCRCAKSGRPCLSCSPLQSGQCQNGLGIRQGKNTGSRVFSRSAMLRLPCSSYDDGDVAVGNKTTGTDELNGIDLTKKDEVLTDNEEDEETAEKSVSRGRKLELLEKENSPSMDLVDVGHLMDEAYGAQLEGNGGLDSLDEWGLRWRTMVGLQNRLYIIPGGAVGRRYVGVLSDEVKHTAIGNYPSDRLVVFSAVMLQRDKMIRKVRDIRKLLVRRLDMWERDEFDGLVQEATRCNRSMKMKRKSDNSEDHVVKVFTRLMLQGKVRPAVRWLTDKVGGVLDPNGTIIEKGTDSGKRVLDVLRQKHPDSTIPSKSALCEVTGSKLPLIEDVAVNGGHVLRVARMIQGGAGPGGCDSTHWQDTLMRFGAHSERLRDSVASLINRLANSIVSWQEMRALMANRLIALDKCPGVRPVGIGEALRRILGKVMVMVTRYEVEEVAGVSQLCAGVKGGIEGAIHAMTDMFEGNKMEGWGVLLVDAKNAFNSLNRIAVLWNARIMWPRCSKFIFNTYRGWALLVVADGKSIVFSREGVTQGDPLSMFLYAVGTLPLIRKLNSSEVTQVWYADDASATGMLNDLKSWFEQLVDCGPSYGYFPEPAKSYLIVDERYGCAATELFEEYGVKVVQSRRMLGGIIGDNDGKKEFFNDLVKQWKYKLKTLT